VARVTVYGGAVRQLQVQIDPARLRASGLGLAEVLATLRAALTQRSGGVIELPSQRLLLSIADPAADAAAIGLTVLAGRSGRPLLLRNVADIRDGAAVAFGDALSQGRRGVLLTMSGQFGANTLTTTRAVEAALAELRPALAAQGVQVIAPLHRPANFIELALRNLGQSLLLGSLLILALLLALLRNWRTVLISFLTIPLSLLLAVLVLHAFGASVNTLTLGGFAVALGVLVDDAIIDIENIVRRLKLNAGRAVPLPFLEVVRAASVEIRASVLYATVVVLLVFVPVLAMSGVQGRLLGPLALAFALSVLASLLVALSITPALCALLLRDHAEVGASRWQRWLGAHHDAAMRWVDRRLRTLLGGWRCCCCWRCWRCRVWAASFFRCSAKGISCCRCRAGCPAPRLRRCCEWGGRSAPRCCVCRTSPRSSSRLDAPNRARTLGAVTARSSTSSSNRAAMSISCRRSRTCGGFWPAIPGCSRKC